jgi:hypothetical protein
MKPFEVISGVYMICGLACCGIVRNGPEAEPDASAGLEPTAPASNHDEVHHDASDDYAIRGSASRVFEILEPGACRALGVPISWFLSGAFGPEDLVSETATPISGTQCLHQQVIAAPADDWAAFAYSAICQGGDDTRLCGAQAARLCSVEILNRSASERTEPVAFKDPTFDFDFVLPPLDRAARLSLDRRLLKEVHTLLLESEAVLSAASAGTRDCPGEDPQAIYASCAAAGELYREISERLGVPPAPPPARCAPSSHETR